MTTKPRGLRNKNPLNIKIGNDWIGEVDNNTDGVFEQFTDLRYGYRAAFIILRKYIRKYRRNTIRRIVDSWSPDGRKIQDAYMESVSKFTGIPLDDEIHFENMQVMVAIVQAMARVENGCDVERTPIVYGYEMANRC